MKYLEEKIMKFLMYCSIGIILLSLLFIFAVTICKGGHSIIEKPGIVTSMPGPKYLLGGEGGFLHAIVGSLYLVIPATIIATILSCMIAIYLQSDYTSRKMSDMIRIFIDILWGTPSIIYGIFLMIILMLFRQRGSLVAGIIALTFLELPIITRTVDEALGASPQALKEIAYSMGLTRAEVYRIILKYSASGIFAGVLIGLGRAFGDAASVIFTTGAASTLPSGLFSSVTALPIIIFQQANSYYPSVRDHAYAASFVLIFIILVINIVSRLIQKGFSKYRVGV